MRGRKAQAAHDAEHMVGLVGRRMGFAIPTTEPHEPSETGREVHELTHLLPRQWCDHCVKGRRSVQNQHSRLLRLISVFSKPLEACLVWWQTKEGRVLYWSRRTLDTWRRFTQQRRRSLITWLRVVVGSLKSSSEGEPLALRRRTATVTLASNKKKLRFFLIWLSWKERRGKTVGRIPRNVLSGRFRNKSR